MLRIEPFIKFWLIVRWELVPGPEELSPRVLRPLVPDDCSNLPVFFIDLGVWHGGRTVAVWSVVQLAGGDVDPSVEVFVQGCSHFQR